MTAPGTGLSRGDILPDVSLRMQGGQPVLFGARCGFGVPLVFWMPDGAPDPLTATMLAGQFEAFVSAGARIFIVLRGETLLDSLPADLRPLGLIDTQGALRAALGPSGGGPSGGGPSGGGLSGSALVVLEADGRVLMAGKPGALGAALAACRAVFERTRPITVRAQAPALMIPDVLEPALCAALMDYWQTGDKMVNAVASPGRGAAVQSTGAKRRTDVLIEDPGLAAALRTRLVARVLPAVEKAFCFKIAEYQTPRVGCYDAADAGAFQRHRDNMTPYTRLRRFAMTLNLNTGQYEGGALWFPEFGRQLYEPEAGGAVVFSCSLLHEALPVIAGRRFGVFIFFFDADAAAQDRMESEHPEQSGVLDS